MGLIEPDVAQLTHINGNFFLSGFLTRPERYHFFINVIFENILPHNDITATHKHKLGLAPWTNQAEFHSPPDVSIFTPKNMIKPH